MDCRVKPGKDEREVRCGPSQLPPRSNKKCPASAGHFFIGVTARYFFLSSFSSSSFFFANNDNILFQSALTLSNSSILAPFFFMMMLCCSTDSELFHAQ